jgi:HD-like signal output (HDOD) protein
MAIQSTRGTDAWIERISVQEMPALCATVRMLEKMAQDDNMSLADLGKSILHDNGLTTRILRVANSVTYSRGSNQVTTISRAVVLLGFGSTVPSSISVASKRDCTTFSLAPDQSIWQMLKTT